MSITQTIPVFSGSLPNKDTDTPEQFDTKAQSSVTYWGTLAVPMNTYAGQANSLASAVNTNAGTASTGASTATTQAAIAVSAANTATQQATNAAQSASAAADSATQSANFVTNNDKRPIITISYFAKFYGCFSWFINCCRYYKFFHTIFFKILLLYYFLIL